MPARIRVPPVALALVLALFPAQAARSQARAACDEPLATHLPSDAALCLRRAGVALPPSDRDPATRALFDGAEAHVAAGRFDAAFETLACAEVVAGDDPLLRYELTRRHGILEFRRERIPQALRRFECAATQASALGARADEARDLKNVGAALRRLGDFQGALRALTASLDMQRANGEVSGAVYNNLGDVYRELEDSTSAMRYYGEALALYRAKHEATEAAHVLESMAEQALDTGDAVRADTWLKEALETYRAGGNRVYELRVHDGLTRAALARGDVADAQRWTASALAIASEGGLPLPPALQLQIARTERLSGRPDVAANRANDALATMAEGDPERVPLLEALAAAQSDLGRHEAANASLRQAHAEAHEVWRAQSNRQLDWLRLRFETSERDRTIAALKHRNRVRTLQLWALLGSVLAIALGGWLLLDRRRQRQRLEAETRRIRLEEELARYRREADALAEDRELLQTLLDSREDAACLLDADGQVLVANRAACRLIGVDAEQLVGQSIVAVLDSADGAARGSSASESLDSALERMEDSAVQSLDVATRDGAPLTARLAQWAGGSGRLVLELGPRADAAAAMAVDTPEAIAGAGNHAIDERVGDEAVQEAGGQEEGTHGDGAHGDGVRDAFRKALVDVMLAAIEAWESATATNRIELAEKSRIWRVNIDDGRLRARAMERYLSVSKLPRNPRWRDVLRTAYYVLGQCPAMREDVRIHLQAQVDAVLAYTRRDAMV
ncbi:MAG: PAS domain-containing protein [Xanthomonadaceae bacterium]|nr:PAS domain-containing protein [Xanthomonadaceae bacterium]